MLPVWNFDLGEEAPSLCLLLDVLVQAIILFVQSRVCPLTLEQLLIASEVQVLLLFGSKLQLLVCKRMKDIVEGLIG